MLDLKVLPQGPLRSGEAELDRGLPRALASVQQHLAGHGGVVGTDNGSCG
jgi:hypothetical protein